MKKLLNISVIAALAILPMAANAAVGQIVSVSDPTAASAADPAQAANAVTATTPPKYALAVEGANDGSLATAGYVKGAYNATMKAINKVADMATSATDSGNISYDGTASGLSASTVQAAIDELADEKADAAYSNQDMSATTLAGAIDELQTEKLDASAADVADDGNYISAGTGVAANLSALDTAVDGLADSKLDASAADVADNGNYISAGTGVAANLGALDSQVKDNADAIDVLNGDASTAGSVAKQIADAIGDQDFSAYAKKTGVVDTITHSTVTTTAATGTVSILDTWGDDTATTANVTIPALTGSIATAAGGYSEPAQQGGGN